MNTSTNNSEGINQWHIERGTKNEFMFTKYINIGSIKN